MQHGRDLDGSTHIRFAAERLLAFCEHCRTGTFLIRTQSVDMWQKFTCGASQLWDSGEVRGIDEGARPGLSSQSSIRHGGGPPVTRTRAETQAGGEGWFVVQSGGARGLPGGDGAVGLGKPRAGAGGTTSAMAERGAPALCWGLSGQLRQELGKLAVIDQVLAVWGPSGVGICHHRAVVYSVSVLLEHYLSDLVFQICEPFGGFAYDSNL